MHLRTDQDSALFDMGRDFAGHKTVNHTEEEYVRCIEGKPYAFTNTAEGFFSIFKRGLIGVYHHVGEQHLKCYLSEFDFCYNNRASLEITDDMRATKTLEGISGKRPTYRRIA